MQQKPDGKKLKTNEQNRPAAALEQQPSLITSNSGPLVEPQAGSSKSGTSFNKRKRDIDDNVQLWLNEFKENYYKNKFSLTTVDNQFTPQSPTSTCEDCAGYFTIIIKYSTNFCNFSFQCFLYAIHSFVKECPFMEMAFSISLWTNLFRLRKLNWRRYCL